MKEKSSPGYTFYDLPQNILKTLQHKKGEPIADGLNMLDLRSDEVIQRGNYTYNGEVVPSKQRANEIIGDEISRLLGEVARKTSNSRATSLLQTMRQLCHNVAEYDFRHNCDPGLGDWLQPLLGFKHLADDIFTYAPRAEITLPD